FRDQLLVFLDAGLGTRRGELGALRWMDGLRFQQPGLRHPTFLLLAPGRASHRYQVGGFGSAAADAPRAQRGPSGVEITKPLQPARRLRLRFGKAEGSQAARSSCRVEKEDPARVQEDWH